MSILNEIRICNHSCRQNHTVIVSRCKFIDLMASRLNFQVQFTIVYNINLGWRLHIWVNSWLFKIVFTIYNKINFVKLKKNIKLMPTVKNLYVNWIPESSIHCIHTFYWFDTVIHEQNMLLNSKSSKWRSRSGNLQMILYHEYRRYQPEDNFEGMYFLGVTGRWRE